MRSMRHIHQNKKIQQVHREWGRGGRICQKCIKSCPDKALNCHLWVPHDREAYCRNCSAAREDLLNCYACDLDICIDCVEPLTLAFWLSTGSMFVLCSGCCPTELFQSPKDTYDLNQNRNFGYFCALCQSHHVGQQPDSPDSQCAECDLPAEEVPPICKRAYTLRYDKNSLKKRSNGSSGGKTPSQTPKTSPVQELAAPETLSASSSPKTAINKSDSDLTISILALKEVVLDLAGNMNNINQRIELIEKSKNNENKDEFNFQDCNKMTQTEMDSSKYPPASAEAAKIWEHYQLSKKSQTELLIEALKNLDLKSVLENQNSQFRQQSNTLNNLSRSILP